MVEKNNDIFPNEESNNVASDDSVVAPNSEENLLSNGEEILQKAVKKRKMKLWHAVVIFLVMIVLAITIYKVATHEEPDVTVEEAVISVPIVEAEPAVDFDALLAENPETKAWLTIPGAGVDHVVVQDDKIPTSNSDYEYLHSDFYGNPSSDGTLFFEPTNVVGEPVEGNDNFYSQNLIIYGHNMRDGDMFGELSNYEDEAFYKENPTIVLTTPDGEFIYEIFAVCELAIYPTSSDPDPFYYIQSDFETQEEFIAYCAEAKSRSLYDIPVEINEGDEILTLSTCSDTKDDYRFVIFAKKIDSGYDGG